MKIEIDLELLEEIGLEPTEYIFLHLIHKQSEEWITCTKLFINVDINSLEEKNMLVLISGTTKIERSMKVGQAYLDLFASDFTDLFKELIDTYPAIVESPGRGKRVLHAKDPGALSNMKAKNKYRKITGEKVLEHKRIIGLLKVQLSQGNLEYLQNLDTWLNNYTWEKYIDINLEEEKDEGRITRSL